LFPDSRPPRPNQESIIQLNEETLKNSEKYGKLAEKCAKNNSKFNCEAKGSFGNKIQLLRRKEFEIVGSIESSTCQDEITSSSSIQYQKETFVFNKNFIKTTDKITYPEELKEELVTIGIMIYIVEKKKPAERAV